MVDVKDEGSQVKKRWDCITQTKRVEICFETELTTKIHYDDVVCQEQVGRGSFGVVFKGTFLDNTVALRKMKET